MATGRVRAGFFHTRTRPAGLSPKPEPGPFINRIFFPGARTRLRRAPRAPWAPLSPVRFGPNPQPNQKKIYIYF